MTNSEYNKIKLTIYEECDAGNITPEQKYELMTMLESDSEESKITVDKAEEFLDELIETFPSVKKEANALKKKLTSGDEEKDDDENDDTDDGEETTESTSGGSNDNIPDTVMDYYTKLKQSLL